MKYDLIETGKRIAEIRKQNGLTQEQLADKLFLSHDHMCRVEKGNRAASLDVLIDISNQFDVSLDYLILGKKRVPKQIKNDLHELVSQLIELEERI